MKIESFQTKLSPKWLSLLQPWLESKECDKIYKFLKERSKTGAKIMPPSNDTFKPFNACKYEDLKVCMIGDFFLKDFYRAVNNDVYPGEDLAASDDLHFLQMQGVLLLSSSLTREGDKNHEDLWMPLYVYLIEKIFNLQNNGLVYILTGQAQRYNWCISEVNSHILYTDMEEDTKVFSQANKIIEGNIGAVHRIVWDEGILNKLVDQVPF